ncbi:MAG: hypothetical protein BKPUNTRY_000301 [Candidatus Fervidibacter sp.]
MGVKGARTLIRIGTFIVVILGVISLIGWLQQMAWQKGQGTRTHIKHKKKPIFPQEREVIALLREIANKQDRKRVGLVLKHLDHESEGVRATAALMIGRLGGGIEVENKLTQLSRSSKQDGWAAQIALARLRAEAKSSEPSEQVDIFLKELGISLSRLRQAGWESAITDAPISFETMALRELADMIAKANRRGVDTRAVEDKIPFEVDYPSALKVRLSKMGQRERIAFLIRNILTLRPTREREYDAQALADEGRAAVPAIVSALQKVHDEIKRNGFTKLGGELNS